MSTRALLKQLSISATSRRAFSSTASLNIDFTHAIIGGGAVGLAIARQLSARPGTCTILLERHGSVGTETSSRNSEVIHAGLYYGAESLKTKLCIRGREMLYELCDKQNIPYRRTGKWIVAQTEAEWDQLLKMHDFSKSIDVPTQFIPLDEATRLEPEIRARVGVLESPTTGILDSHAYMQHLLGAFLDRGGDIAYNTYVNALSHLPSSSGGGYAIATRDGTTGDESSITASCLINSAGLAACSVANMLLPPDQHVVPYYAKGNYFSYTSSPAPKISRLIYPAPVPGHGGLGTHLTMDLGGALRFGPDVQWVDSPDDLSVSAERLPAAVSEIWRYFPGLDEKGLRPDYAGVRPKLARGGGVAGTDFLIRKEKGAGMEGVVNLLGIESPGLTASLAIAQEVERLLY